MIITISGQMGTESRIIGRILARKLNMPHHSAGRFIRNLAERRGISLDCFTKEAEKDTSIDNDIDLMIADHGRTKDNFIIDSKLAFHFIPKSVKILLKADLNTRVNRNFKYDSRTEFNVTRESTLERIKRIDNSDKKRFLQKYGLDYTDPKKYDLVIDNSNISLEECADKIVEFLRQKRLISMIK